VRIEENQYSFEIRPLKDRLTKITVYKAEKPNCLNEEGSPAQVNWPAIGSVDPYTARLFAAALIRAAEIAEEQ